MSTIKNLVKTFKERQVAEMTAPDAQNNAILENVKTEEVPTVKKSAAAKKVKAGSSEKGRGEAQKKTTKSSMQPIIKEKKDNEKTVMSNNVLTDDFFNTLNEQSFSYEKSKFAYIDKKIYEILMTLKRKKDVKNISLLINAALSQFIEQNKDDIRNIFTDDLL